MGKHAQIVMGPAGSGKSTYCKMIQDHCSAMKRSCHVVNLDPAAEEFGYQCSIDIRELVSLDDVMEEMEFGPNGGLVYCMEYLVENLDWFEDKISDFDDDYLIFDCPGQIELYSHLPMMKRLIAHMQKMDYNMCAVYLLDSVFITDATRFISGSMMCLSAMVQLELPHVNILSKCDMVEDPKQIERFLDPPMGQLLSDLDEETTTRHRGLNRAFSRLLEDYSMVSYLPLHPNEDSIALVLAHIDNAIQYGEDLEPKEPDDMQ